MEELRRFYLQSLQGRISALEMAKLALLENPKRAAESIELIAHSLKGSGSVYGYPRITEAAGALEESDDGSRPALLDGLLAVLKNVRAESGNAKTGILVVEDEEVNAILLTDMLSAPDREVHLAENGEQAFRMLAEKKIDLIVLDLILPDMDGRACLMRLKETPATALLPVVIQSGKVGELTRQECLSLGAAAFLHKPYDPDEIRSVVEAALAGHALPASTPVRPAEAEARAAGIGPGRIPPVLLAEDDPLIAKIIKHRLGREGFEVEWHADGESAYKAASASPYSLAILDVKMPMMDGFELLGRLRELPDGGRMPILMLTSLGREQDVVRGFALGANDYLTKPFSPTELVARARNLQRKK